MSVTEKTISHIQAMHARYFESIDNSTDDLVYVKELVHYTDGTTERRMTPKVNIQRPFYITKKGHQNHLEKKEWESQDKLIKYTCKQSELIPSIRRALGQYPSERDRYPQVARSPYLYGSDITSSVLVKNSYDRAMKGKTVAPYTVAALDLETDTLRGTGEIVTGAICTMEEVYVYYTDAYMGTETTLVDKLESYDYRLLGERIDISKIKFHIEKVANPVDVTIRLLADAHRLRPDFLAVWNMTFDINKMIDSLKDAGYDPRDHFCDPSIPKKFRYFEWVEAPRIKVMASGKTMTKHVADLWHVLSAPSSFYFVDAMCLYKLVRAAAGMEPSYALDDILIKHKLGGKLRFDKADGLNKLEWHQHMSSKYKVEYIEYNIYDCLSMLQLDRITRDISTVLPLLCGHSDLHKFTSTPRRLADDVEFMCYERGLVAGTTSDQMSGELDKHVVGIDRWIVTLPGHHTHKDMGINIYSNDGSNIRTGIVTHNYDSDVLGAYPSGEDALNISKETTAMELCSVGDLDGDGFRKFTLNMTSPEVNAVEICIGVMKAPTPYQLDALYKEQLAKEKSVA